MGKFLDAGSNGIIGEVKVFVRLGAICMQAIFEERLHQGPYKRLSDGMW